MISINSKFSFTNVAITTARCLAILIPIMYLTQTLSPIMLVYFIAIFACTMPKNIDYQGLNLSAYLFLSIHLISLAIETSLMIYYPSIFYAALFLNITMEAFNINIHGLVKSFLPKENLTVLTVTTITCRYTILMLAAYRISPILPVSAKMLAKNHLPACLIAKHLAGETMKQARELFLFQKPVY